MHTRPATPSDIPTIATISAHAFQTDELFNFTNPYARTHQRDFRDYFLRRTRLRYWTPGFIFYVAETDPDDPPPPLPPPPTSSRGSDEEDAKRESHGGGEVVGFCLYNLHPPAGSALLHSSPPLLYPYTALLERTLCSLHDSYIALLRLDRSVSVSRARFWRAEQSAAFQRFWDEQGPVGNEDGRGYYTLQGLCVEPSWQRRGVGARLIELGQMEAGREGVKVVLTSSEVGAGLYVRMGFVRKGELRVEGWRSGGKREKREGEKGDVQAGGAVVVREAGEAKVEEKDVGIVPIFVWEPASEKNSRGEGDG